MDEGILAFVICCIVGVLFIALGIFSACSKKPAGFWANAAVGEITDVKGYNRAVGKLFAVYGIVFILCCIPVLAGQNSAWIILTILGVMLESIGAMIVYTIVIEKKYRKK